jgi:hypothetical protein
MGMEMASAIGAAADKHRFERCLRNDPILNASPTSYVLSKPLFAPIVAVEEKFALFVELSRVSGMPVPD